MGRYINTYNNKNQYIVRHTQYIQNNHQVNLSYALKYAIIQQRHNKRVSTSQFIQRHIFHQLEFKFNPLKISSGVTILWTYIFHVSLHSTTRLIFIMKSWFVFRSWNWYLFLFIFKRENKIRNKVIRWLIF